jgi:cytochrome P450
MLPTVLCKTAWEIMDTTISTNNSNVPPGPKTPWFGLPLLRDMQKDALGAGLKLREEHGDAVHFRMANQSYYYFFAPELIREVLVEHADDFIRHERAIEVFSNIYGDNVLTTEGERWQRQRRILLPGFSPKRINGYVGLMTAAALECLDAALPRASGMSATIDVDGFTTTLTMDVILRVLFSHKTSEEESRRAFEAMRTLEHQGMRELFWPTTPADWFPYPGRKQKLQAMATLHNMIKGQIRQRREAASAHADKTDYLAMLLSAHDEEAQTAATATLTNEEICDNCLVLFAAGHDTTATVLTWWIGLMAQHPEYVAKVRQEVEEALGDRNPTAEELSRLKWTNATIKEAMRLYPPTPNLFFRRAVRDVRIGEWHVAKGASVNIPVWHVQHDARWFPEPERFMPERFMPNAPEIPRGAYLPFGSGPRVCIGQHLATIEMAMTVTFLIRRYDLSLAEGQGLPKPRIDMVLKPEKPLLVKFARR